MSEIKCVGELSVVDAPPDVFSLNLKMYGLNSNN